MSSSQKQRPKRTIVKNEQSNNINSSNRLEVDDDEEIEDENGEIQTIEFLEKSNIAIKQSNEERRQLREEYRTIIDETERFVDDSETVSTSAIAQRIGDATRLFEQVKLPREGVYDTRVLKQAAEIGVRKAAILHTGFQNFNEDNFAKQLISFTKDIEIDDEDADRNDLEQADWENLAKLFSPSFKTSPGLNFLSSCFERDPSRVKPERRARKARQKDAISELVKPKKVSNESKETEEERTTKLVEHVHSCLKFAYKDLKNTPIGYFEFVVDPQSFEKSVENMFYLSFLIKDGFAKMSMDSNGLPTIEPIEKDPNRSLMGAEGTVDRKQCVISISYDEWKEIVETFEIEEALIFRRQQI